MKMHGLRAFIAVLAATEVTFFFIWGDWSPFFAWVRRGWLATHVFTESTGTRCRNKEANHGGPSVWWQFRSAPSIEVPVAFRIYSALKANRVMARWTRRRASSTSDSAVQCRF